MRNSVLVLLRHRRLEVSNITETVADPGFAKGEGADHGEHAEHEPKRG